MKVYDNIKLETVLKQIEYCQEADHSQQAVYSTYHAGLTQICFTCDHVFTSCKNLRKGVDF